MKFSSAPLVLPEGSSTSRPVKANFRTWSELFEKRCHPAAPWELRGVCEELRKLLAVHAPIVFVEEEER